MSKVTHYMRSKDGNVFSTQFPEYHEGEEKLSRAEGKKLYREQTCADLLKLVKPGMTVYTQIVHRSSSGMTRRVSMFVIEPARKGEPARLVRIDYAASIVSSMRLSKDGGLIIDGCGFDAGFDAVYRLGLSLWPDGTRKPHGTRNGEPDRDGGYALKQSAI